MDRILSKNPWVALVLMILVACSGTPPSPLRARSTLVAEEPSAHPPTASAATKPTLAASNPRTDQHAASPTIIGRSVEGRALEHHVFGQGPRNLFFLASIHGDEHSGTPLCHWLIDELDRRPQLLQGLRVIIMPEVNPDGLAARRRHNARGVDLNRNFPSGNFSKRSNHGQTPLSEPESRYLHELLRAYPPDLVLSFHQDLNLLDYDGPGRGWAKALSGVSPLNVRRLGSRPGSLGSYVGIDLRAPILTVELSRRDLSRSPSQLIERYAPMLLRALQPLAAQ